VLQSEHGQLAGSTCNKLPAPKKAADRIPLKEAIIPDGAAAAQK
jgi:hypothetical protein